VINYCITRGILPKFARIPQVVVNVPGAQCRIARKMASCFRNLARNTFVFGGMKYENV